MIRGIGGSQSLDFLGLTRHFEHGGWSSDDGANLDAQPIHVFSNRQNVCAIPAISYFGQQTSLMTDAVHGSLRQLVEITAVSFLRNTPLWLICEVHEQFLLRFNSSRFKVGTYGQQISRL